MKRWLYIAGLFLGLLAAIRIYSLLRSPSAKQRRFATIATEEAVAFKLGQTVRENIPGNGEVLFVQLPAATDAAQNAWRRRVKIFNKGLGGKAVPVSPERLPPREQYQLQRQASAGAWGELFLQWTQSHPSPRAIVSFMGVPTDLPAEKIRALGPLLVFSGNRSPEAEQWLTDCNVVAWVVPKSTFRGGPSSGSHEKVFDAGFELRSGRH